MAVRKDEHGNIIACGRKAMLAAMDSMLEDHHNIQKFADAIQEDFDESPIQFFKEIVMPLTPKAFLEEGGEREEDKADLMRDALKEMDAAMEGVKELVDAMPTTTTTKDFDAGEDDE